MTRSTLPTLLCSVSLCLCGGLVIPLNALDTTARPAQRDDPRTRFIGHYRLITFEMFDDKGAGRIAPYDGGRIMYDAAGQMAAQLMRSARTPLGDPPTDAQRAAAYSTYTAYYGRYTVDAAAGTVTHHVEGSVNPNWVKTDLVRWFAFSPDGSRLMLSVKNASGRVTGTLTWERIR